MLSVTECVLGSLFVFKFALTTCPDLATAHLLAERLVQEDLAACVNIIPSVISVYKWQGQIEQSQESQLFIKTVESNLAKIESLLSEHHSYELPEFIVLDISTGNQGYLDWLIQNTTEK